MAQLCRWAVLRLQGMGISTSEGGDGRDDERRAQLSSCGPDSEGRITIDAQHLPHILGVELFEPNIAERLTVGVSMGLAVSAVGGDLLFIEATRAAGAGVTITGNVKSGNSMHESVQTAMSFLQSRVAGTRLVASADSADNSAGLSDKNRLPFHNEHIHVHFPAGAIPKDGPSAGVAILLAIASLLLNKPIRSDTAVTGEVTLRGHVLPVGGIRDKVLAAKRAGVTHVLIPFANQRNVLEDIPETVLEGVEVHYLKHADEALDWAFGKGVLPKPPVIPSKVSWGSMPSPLDSSVMAWSRL